MRGGLSAVRLTLATAHSFYATCSFSSVRRIHCPIARIEAVRLTFASSGESNLRSLSSDTTTSPAASATRSLGHIPAQPHRQHSHDMTAQTSHTQTSVERIRELQ